FYVVMFLFAEGLRTLGLLDMMQIHHSTFKTAFCSSDKPLKATDLMMLFQAELTFLDGVFEITLDQLLVFASGADRIPALGFSPQPTLNFIHETGRKYPEANTCLVKLKLPIHNTYEVFTKYMCEGIVQAPTFGLA
uniref:HECT domain-containing protein n=1 Tax=Sinocyclocheilus rhinocerous TaxID=307959 RepID=A0A673FE31_9TELE